MSQWRNNKRTMISERVENSTLQIQKHEKVDCKLGETQKKWMAVYGKYIEEKNNVTFSKRRNYKKLIIETNTPG